MTVFSSSRGDVAAQWRDAGLAECFAKAAKLHKAMRGLVPEALEHTGAANFDEHLLGVSAVLRAWKQDEALALAGLYHSIYGTEGFQGFMLPWTQRPAIRELIGDRAERLVFLYCVMDRSSFDRACTGGALDASTTSAPHAPCRLDLRARPELGGFELKNTRDEFLDLATLFLADILEQVEGIASKALPAYGWQVGQGWGYRRFAYRAMANILARERDLSEAKVMYDTVFAQEPPELRASFIPVTPPLTPAAKDALACLRARNI